MPEYSSTTITPSDGVQVPGMNGSTSGNFLLSALKSYILSEKGLANGLASLDGNGKLLSSQLPDLADDVIVVASYATLPATGTAGKLYITADNNKMYRWDPDLTTPDYVELSVDLSAYATKAELAAEESARESADTDLKSAIQGNTARIENLEQEHGGYVPVQYRGTNAVPPNKAKYALVESIVGKSRAWNQLINNGDFRSTGRLTNYNGTVSYDSSGVTGVLPAGSYYNQAYYKNLETSIPSGHTVLVVLIGSATTMRLYHDNAIVGEPVSINNAVIIPNISGLANQLRWGPSSIAEETTYKWSYVLVRDLTLIFPEGVPSTVAECVQKCPDILKYDAYGYSLPSTTVSGVKSIGYNLLDPNNLTQVDASDVATTNRIKVVGGQTYQFNVNESQTGIYIEEYDADGNQIKDNPAYSTNKVSATLQVNTASVRLVIYKSGTTVAHVKEIEPCFHVGTTIDYSPYMEDTLTFPAEVELNGIGTCIETYNPETGVIDDGKFGEYTFTGAESWSDAGDGRWQTNALDSNSEFALVQASVIVDGIISGFGVAKSANDIYYERFENSFAWTTDYSYRFRIYASWLDGKTEADIKALFTGIKFRCRKRTFTPSTPLAPIINNTIETEGGGTINTIQTQTPVLDNSLDVGYLAL